MLDEIIYDSKEGRDAVFKSLMDEGMVASYNRLDAGPAANFTMALSLIVNCKTQKEVDTYYDKLSKGGEKQPCGWVKDKFGVSWQIAPEILMKLMGDKNKVTAGRVMQAMMQMHKIDIAKLKKAYAGK